MTKYNRKWQHLYDYRWTKYSKLFLSKNPLCVYCLQIGKTTPATVTDHTKPHRGNVALFWNVKNHQALCEYCHNSVKRIEEERGYQIGHGADGMPIGRHPWNEE